MTECRNQLMKEGKPYPRSSCSLCGHLLQPGGAKCVKNVLPDKPEDARFYVPVAEKVNTMKYGVVVEKSYSSSDTYGGFETTKYDQLLTFDTEDDLKTWYKSNLDAYSKQIVKKVIRFNEVKVATEVTISVS